MIEERGRLAPQFEWPSAQSPEQRLWIGVLLQFLQDLESVKYRLDPTVKLSTRYLRRGRVLPRSMTLERECLRLLREMDGDWFDSCCGFAGWDADYVRMKVRRYMAEVL